MAEFLNYLGSAKFFGILLMTGGTCFLLLPEFYGWFDSKPRHFWFPKLTYENKDTQSLVRSSWVLGILLLIIGSVVYVMASSQTLMLNFLRVVYWLIATWILLKLVLLVSIICVKLWNWIVHDTPLFKN